MAELQVSSGVQASDVAINFFVETGDVTARGNQVL